jgi:hypothetical protein
MLHVVLSPKHAKTVNFAYHIDEYHLLFAPLSLHFLDNGKIALLLALVNRSSKEKCVDATLRC